MKNILILGGNGFIGTNLALKLKNEGHYVVVIDRQRNEHIQEVHYNVFIHDDLTRKNTFRAISKNNFDEIYQLAAEMGGAGYVFTGENDADIMHNSSLIHLHLLDRLKHVKYSGKLFFSSSACVYPQEIQAIDGVVDLKESDAYPANPDSNYGWEKLYAERLYTAYAKKFGFDLRIARLHNVFGEYGSYDNGREKAPAAICRKIAMATEGGQIEIWGTGLQKRTFLYIDECLTGIEKLMESDIPIPINIGSSESISINGLADMVMDIAQKPVSIKNIVHPAIGVNSRSSDNEICFGMLKWKPTMPLVLGMSKTYEWINEQIKNK